ncbi:PREDICTED: rhythmically expressed gene 5 protein [Nicrophorus vespilloides]|uniref:Rhythmically expressed gene 5 protein n=1 Tax=Nicrophorus vespilloides TaxID=110193 RepID=A0ABM1MAQ2_NICVS|nr:PREDICTED: rhythmically expressed gene 5 protein [Nicrophorus vespilloides]
MIMFGLLCFCAAFGEITSSAIPMWEYLSKDEKMSYLYSMFANQVETFCESSDMKNCNQDLLKYGLNKLKVMPEDHLDTMDPYQRGAHTLIWDSMMEGHEMMSKKPKQKETSSVKPNSYDDQSSFSLNEDYQGQASARIETVYKVLPPRNVLTISSGPSQYKTPFVQNKVDYVNVPLTGPMVVKVHLDGSPVKDHTDLPQDDDLKHYKMSKLRLPNFS